jgi:aryl-alcohol dehydrogenase-like predicted oxidoreductase
MSAETLESSAAPAIGPRDIADTGVFVSPIGLDGSVFGWAAGMDDTALMLDAYAAGGGNFICTADHYSGGRSEIMIGSWLRTLPDRDSVVLSTRVGKHPDAEGLSKRSILRAVENSLTRLGTDYIDFLAFDGDDSDTPIDESLETVDRLIREGKVRFLAESGFSADRILEVGVLAAEAAYPDFRALFAEYNLMDRHDYESELAPLASLKGRAGLAQLPLAAGYLTAQFRTRDQVPHSVLYEGSTRHIGRRGSRILDSLETVAKELDETPARVALAWLLVKPGIAAAILRAKDPAQVAHALGAADVRLARHHVSALDKASAY